MWASEFNKERYSEIWTDLNRKLEHIERSDGGLAAALEALRNQQLEQGFIKDDLHSVRRYRFAHPEDPTRFFFAQYNPVRALRFAGAGRSTPPAGTRVKYDGCFLCRDNIQWQQSGLELGYEIDVDSTRYIAWMNAYPLMPLHCVIASNDHLPQAWCTNGAANRCLRTEKILKDLVTLSRRLPGYLGFYNGEGAGASIQGHLHFQFFKRPECDASFPLEVAARKSGIETHGTIDNYPLAVVYWRGDLAEVVESASRWIRGWMVKNGHQLSSISANIVSTFDDVEKKLELFFVPRHQLRSQSPEMSGTIGGLEVLGEMVFSSEEEGQRLELGRIDYHTVERILAAVRFD
jgi:hypothetical protein